MSEWEKEAAAHKAKAAETLASLGLTIESAFVPYSQSRNAGGEWPSLNWRVTVKRNGRDVLATDYSAGVASCPGHAAKKPPVHFVPHEYKSRNPKRATDPAQAEWIYRRANEREALEQYRKAIAAAEIESGYPMEIDQFAKHMRDNVFKRKAKAAPILPDPVDVFYSLTMDSSVLDSAGFESWAEDCGYDTDSRKAESIYRACLDIALKLRGAIGESGFAALQETFQDY